jgi:transcriptional regulator with XRE-family HTH domain
MTDKMNLMPRVDFADWLRTELDVIDRTQAWLAQTSGLSQGYLSKLMNRERMAGRDACAAIAKALGKKDVEVMRAAGIADPEPDSESPNAKALLSYFSALMPSHQEDVIEHAKALSALERAEKPYQIPDASSEA